MSEFKVGYKKPPKEHQFKPKNQTAARRNRERQEENDPDVAALLDKPLKVKRGGKSVRMHPHEAAMISLGKRALNGERRAAKEFLKAMRYCGTACAPARAAKRWRVHGTARRCFQRRQSNARDLRLAAVGSG